MFRGLIYLLLLAATTLTASVYVNGHTRSDGTHVEGYYRSSPNDTVSDNYSTDGNTNPYTGEEGSREVYDDSYAPTSNQNDNIGTLVAVGIVVGLIVLIVILKMLGRILFFSYLVTKLKVVFWTWVVLTLLNQVVFYGACLAPYCILASIPHVTLLTLGIMYLMYKSALDTFDPETSYNEFGYNKDGYDQYGYRQDGYDKHGYNVKGFDREGKDRKGKGALARTFAGSEYHAEIAKLNDAAIDKNIAEQAKNNNNTTDTDNKPTTPVMEDLSIGSIAKTLVYVTAETNRRMKQAKEDQLEKETQFIALATHNPELARRATTIGKIGSDIDCKSEATKAELDEKRAKMEALLAKYQK